MTTPSTGYRDLLIRMKRVRNICNRVKNWTKEDKVHYRHLKASERKIIEREMPIIARVLVDLLSGSDKLGFVLLSMMTHFGLYLEDWETQDEPDRWRLLMRTGDALAGQGIIDFNNYHEYINTLWEMMELSPSEFANRIMLFKLGLV